MLYSLCWIVCLYVNDEADLTTVFASVPKQIPRMGISAAKKEKTEK